MSDPWKNQEQPPDLDEIFKKLFKKFSGGQKNETNKNQSDFFIGSNLNLIFPAILLVVIYFVSGIYIVDPAEQAVVTRFGRYVRTENSGPHWYARFVEDKKIVNVQQVYTIGHEERMLTKDENIVWVEIAVQYQVKDPKDYLFSAAEPENSLKQAAESALRSVIGHSTLDQILTSGRSEIAAQIHTVTEELIASYKLGLTISDVAMQPARAPNEVKEAFDDVIKAQEDEVREVNRAETYARKIEPIARGNATRILEEAAAYKKKAILIAQGQTNKFLKLLPQYKAAPDLTKQRIYLDTMADIMHEGNRIVVDSNNHNITFLPLENWVKANSKPQVAPEEPATPSKDMFEQTVVDETLRQKSEEVGRMSRQRFRELRESGS